MTATDALVADLVAEVCTLELDVIRYRELLQVALSQLADAQTQRAAHGRQMEALRLELRDYVAARVLPCV
jgi:hypothetical protein